MSPEAEGSIVAFLRGRIRSRCLTIEPPGQAALNLGEEGLRTNLRPVAFGFTFCANSCAALPDFRGFHWPLTRGV